MVSGFHYMTRPGKIMVYIAGFFSTVGSHMLAFPHVCWGLDSEPTVNGALH